MNLSDAARQLLQFHAARSQQSLYALDMLGSFFRGTDLQRLDDAYRELNEAGLLAKTGKIITYFGEPKALYRVTKTGAEEAAREPAA
jgi:hypothetical protein